MVTFILTLLGAGMLGYCVYLISGVGIAITATIGILLLMLAIRTWFLIQTHNIETLHEINTTRHYDLLEALRRKNQL